MRKTTVKEVKKWMKTLEAQLIEEEDNETNEE